MSVEVSSLLDKVRDTSFDLTTANVPRKISDVRSILLTFVTALSKHTKTAASHIFVFMISSDKKGQKAICDTYPMCFISWHERGYPSKTDRPDCS